MAITKTIGSGGDYATLASYVSYLLTVDNPFTDDHIGQLLDMRGEALSISALLPAGAGSLTLEPASGQRHAGVLSDSKAGWKLTGAGDTFNYNGTSALPSLLIDSLQIRNANNSLITELIDLRSGASNVQTWEFRNCLIAYEGTSENTGIEALLFGTDTFANTTLIFNNCTFLWIPGVCGPNPGARSLANLYIHNCTFLQKAYTTGTHYGLRITTAPTNVCSIRNCYAGMLTGGGATFRPWDVSEAQSKSETFVFTNNANSGNTASYTASGFDTGSSTCWDSVPVADYFDTTTGARKTYSGGGTNRLDDTGADLGDDYRVDITGAVRSGTWSIGSEEFVNNQPPVLTVTTPAENQTYLTTENVNYNVSATDAESGSLTADIEVDVDGGGYNATNDSGLGVLGTLSAGAHVITFRVQDPVTSVYASVARNISVTTLRAEATASKSTVYAGYPSSIALSGSNSSSVLGPLTYQWTQTAGTSVTISNATSEVASFTVPRVTSDTTLTFQLEVDDGTNSETTTVDVAVQFGYQSVIYALNAAFRAAMQERTERPHSETGLSQSVLYGWTQKRRADGKYDSDGGLLTNPQACYRSNLGTGPMLGALAETYRLTGDAAIKRAVLQVARTTGEIRGFFAGAWPEDAGVVGGQIGYVASSGSVDVLAAGYQNVGLFDDGASQNAFQALVYTARCLYLRGDTEWTEIARHAVDFWHEVIQLQFRQLVIDPSRYTGISGLPNFTNYWLDNKPYADGTFGEFVPFDAAVGYGVEGRFFQNSATDHPFDANPQGPYGYRMPHNDEGVAAYVYAGIEFYQLATLLEANATALPASTVGSVSYSAANIADDLELTITAVCDSYDNCAGFASQVEPGFVHGSSSRTYGAAAHGRGVEPASVAATEHAGYRILSAAYRYLPLDSALKTRIYAKSGASKPTGILQDYFDWLESLPAVDNFGCSVMGPDTVKWQASTAYSLNDEVRADPPTNILFRCTTAGTSGGTQPTWNETYGATTNDGTAVWTAVTSVTKALCRYYPWDGDPNLGVSITAGDARAPFSSITPTSETICFSHRNTGQIVYGELNFRVGSDNVNTAGEDTFGNTNPSETQITASQNGQWASNGDFGTRDDFCYPDGDDEWVHDPDESLTAVRSAQVNTWMATVFPIQRYLSRDEFASVGGAYFNPFLNQRSDGYWSDPAVDFTPDLHAENIWALCWMIDPDGHNLQATQGQSGYTEIDETVIDSDGDGIDDDVDSGPFDSESKGSVAEPTVARRVRVMNSSFPIPNVFNRYLTRITRQRKRKEND